MNLDTAKQILYTAERKEHREAMLIESDELYQKRVDFLGGDQWTPEQIQQMKANTTGEQPIREREFADETAAMPNGGFNGA